MSSTRFGRFFILLVFPTLERGGASLYSPLSIAFRFETQLEVSFQIIKLFAMFCVLLNLRLNLKKCKREQSGVEWADDRVSPCKKQGKTLISETVCFRFRSVRIVVWELGFFIAYYLQPFREISLRPWFYTIVPFSEVPPAQFSFFIWRFTDNLSHWRQFEKPHSNRRDDLLLMLAHTRIILGCLSVLCTA